MPRSGSKRSIAFTRPDARDLHEVVERLVGALVAARELARERQEPLDQLLARRRVALLVVADQQAAVLARAAAGPALPLVCRRLAVVSARTARGQQLSLRARSSGGPAKPAVTPAMTGRRRSTGRAARARPRGAGREPPQQAGHVHLRHPEPLRDLRLGHVLAEPQPQDQPLRTGSALIAASIVTPYSTRS